MRRPTLGRLDRRSLALGVAVGAVVTLLATVAVIPPDTPSNEQGEAPSLRAGGERIDPGQTNGGRGSEGGESAVDPDDPAGATASAAEGTARGSSPQSAGTSGGESRDAVGCAPGQNGGETDTGVTGSTVTLGATVAESGVAESFLGEVRQAMEAVRQRANAVGGVCGRRLEIEYVNDGWDAERGAGALENLIKQEGVFAIAVAPSSEGVNQASLQGLFGETGVPVVGTDGLIRTQYTDPYIWPVAAATTTSAHVMMKHAWDQGARNPAIVFENTYRFGVEGALAFNNAYKRLSGGDIPGFYDPTGGGSGSCDQRFCGIPASDSTSGYATQVNSVNTACGQPPECDFWAFFLEPATALTWMNQTGVTRPENVTHGISAAQPLFTFDFARECGDRCNELVVWTGYNPPLEQYRDDPAVRRYVDELKSQKGSADEFNQFTQGGYLGMELVVEALRRTGPDLTRDALIRTLDSMSLETGLSPTLAWSSGDHFANPAAQAFSLQSQDGFKGFRFENGYVADPWPGEDTG